MQNLRFSRRVTKYEKIKSTSDLCDRVQSHMIMLYQDLYFDKILVHRKNLFKIKKKINFFDR